MHHADVPEAFRHLASPPKLWEALGYQPHEGQRRFHASRARFKILIAGSRFGKSLAAARDVLPMLFSGPTRGWIAAPSYRLGEKEFRYMLADLQQLGVPLVKRVIGGASGASHLRTSWGSEVLVVSAGEPHNLLGEELDWLLLSEASQLPEEIYTRYLRARLASRRGRMVVPTTPRGFNWMHKLWLRGADPDHPDWQSFHYATADNPLIPREEIEEARRTLPKDQFEEQFEGAFTTRSGLVYPEFSPDRHLAELSEPARDWQLYGAMDFGYSNPCVCLFAGLDPAGRLWIYDEYFASSRTMNANAAELIAQGADRLSAIFCDPSAPDSVHELRSRGLRVKASRNPVSYGIDLVRRRLIAGEDGRPALMIASHCRNVIRELTRYRWSEQSDASGEPRPLKQDDHTMDALRYLCLNIDRGVKWQRLR